MKICLLGASFDTNNMGVSALTAGAIACILHSFPEAEVSLLDYGRESRVISFVHDGRSVPIRLVNMRFSKRFYLRNNVARLITEVALAKLIPSSSLREKLLGQNPWLRQVQEMDLVAAISGGDSFSDIYGLPRFIYVCLPQILALLMGKRLVLLPQTLGPFKGRLARATARYIMKRAEAVYSRDHAGVKLGAEMLGLKAEARSKESGVRRETSPIPSPESRVPMPNVRFCYDVGFLLDVMPPPRVDIVGLGFPHRAGASLVGLNVSGLLFIGGYSRKNMFGLKTEYSRFVYELIDFLIRQKNADVLLAPHAFGQHGESDSTVCGQIYEALKEKYPGKIGWVRGNYNQSEIKYVIGKCDFFVGSRMHACIAAVSQCVPAVSIAYSDKFIGVMETVGVEALVADARKMEEAEILKIVEQGFERRGLIRQQLELKIPQVKERVLRLFDEIAEAGDPVRTESGVAAVAASE